MNRKGARSIKEIPADILDELNTGNLSSANLVEWLAVDIEKLLKSVFSQMGYDEHLEDILNAYSFYKPEGVMKRMKAVGKILHDKFVDDVCYGHVYESLATHQSDLCREFASYMNLANKDIIFLDRFKLVERFAKDDHMGVKECAWDSVRNPYLIDNLDVALLELEKWAVSDCEKIRRFAVEITRPCGVWTSHIKALKEHPSKGESILNIVKSDKSRYVQNAVGNWLNDASKYQPDWVMNLSEKWLKLSKTKETKYIVNRGLRTIRKQGDK